MYYAISSILIETCIGVLVDPLSALALLILMEVNQAWLIPTRPVTSFFFSFDLVGNGLLKLKLSEIFLMISLWILVDKLVSTFSVRF